MNIILSNRFFLAITKQLTSPTLLYTEILEIVSSDNK